MKPCYHYHQQPAWGEAQVAEELTYNLPHYDAFSRHRSWGRSEMGTSPWA